jgi:hypothetical protein
VIGLRLNVSALLESSNAEIMPLPELPKNKKPEES